MEFKDDAEVWEVVRRFEHCEYGLTEFDHPRHLAVGLAYLSQGTLEEAMQRMRISLQRFSAHHGKMGYHETITRFWLLRLGGIRQGRVLWQKANAAAAELADKESIFHYYEREVLMSDRARQSWMEPQRPIS